MNDKDKAAIQDIRDGIAKAKSSWSLMTIREKVATLVGLATCLCR